ncbi:hypothetical protein RYH80_08630 [Halobaculum sp. MBLA0147]|uniref:DUF7504 family protein n=1 Tax=Halobaculum sp. MBLA0147 TaxID=3079934 RepID=UPI00352557B7
MSGTSKRPSNDGRTSVESPTPTVVLELREGELADAAETTPTLGERPVVVVGFARGDAELAERLARDRDVWYVDAARSGGTATVSGATVVGAASPTDHTGVGVALASCCESAATTGDPVCLVPSLTALLQYVDARRGYRLCDAVAARVARAGGETRLWLDPAAHDTQTVATFQTLADAVDDRTARDTTTERGGDGHA